MQQLFKFIFSKKYKMNKVESDKFNNILSEGFKELITLRPEKPLDHFIYFLMNSIPEHIRRKDSNLLDFVKNYQRKLQEKENQGENEEQEEISEFENI